MRSSDLQTVEVLLALVFLNPPTSQIEDEVRFGLWSRAGEDKHSWSAEHGESLAPGGYTHPNVHLLHPDRMGQLGFVLRPLANFLTYIQNITVIKRWSHLGCFEWKLVEILERIVWYIIVLTINWIMIQYHGFTPNSVLLKLMSIEQDVGWLIYLLQTWRVVLGLPSCLWAACGERWCDLSREGTCRRAAEDVRPVLLDESTCHHSEWTALVPNTYSMHWYDN